MRGIAPVKTIVKAAAVAALLGTTAIGAAQAQVSVTFDPGTVAYGYSDGYWARDHVWHKWEKPEYVETYRKVPNAHYYEYKHDRDANMGWRGEVIVK
jgi:hypothetical protein